MTTQQAYDTLTAELVAIEKIVNVPLTDENVDAENVIDGGINPNDDGYWEEMIRAAKMAAGMRADEAGLDINALIGRTTTQGARQWK